MRAPIWVQVRGKGGHFAGRELLAGDVVLMSPVEAVRAHRQGLITLARPAPAAIAAAIEAEAAAPAPEPERPPRRYRRRDMVPEP